MDNPGSGGAAGDKRSSEQRALRVSIVSSALLGAVAIGWGVSAESRILLFDGIFVVLGIVLSGLSVLAASAADAAPTSLGWPRLAKGGADNLW